LFSDNHARLEFRRIPLRRARDYLLQSVDRRMSVSSLRESEVLARLACFHYLNSAQLEEFVFDRSTLTPRSRTVTTQQLLERLRERGLITATPSLVGGPTGGSARLVYCLTSAGQRTLDALEGTRSHGRPRQRTLFVGHALMVADIALAFRRAARGCPSHELSEWESDWDAAERLRPSPVIPDAHLVYRTPSWEIDAFVEVDLGTERTSRFTEKVRAYLDTWRSGTWRTRLPSWPLVLTVTTNAARVSTLRHATEELLRSQRDAVRVADVMEFDFAALADLVGESGPLGRIWQVAGRAGLHALLPTDGEVTAGTTPDPDAA